MHKRYIIPQSSTELKEKFINYIMKKGKKSTARKIFSDTLDIIKNKGDDPDKVFFEAIKKAGPEIEVRPKRIGGGVYQIPVEVKEKRRISLAIRWIVNGARTKKGQKMAMKLAQELLDSYNNKGSAIKKKQDVLRMAEANKAFAHLAKY